jgi:hypothetical protein
MERRRWAEIREQEELAAGMMRFKHFEGKPGGVGALKIRPEAEWKAKGCHVSCAGTGLVDWSLSLDRIPSWTASPAPEFP